MVLDVVLHLFKNQLNMIEPVI